MVKCKVWTSRFSNKELQSGNYTVVGIVRGMPKFPVRYTIAGNIIELAPPSYLFNEYDRERFTGKYFKHVDKLGVQKVVSLINRFSGYGKDIVLCCYEDVRKEGEWCHRLVFAEWLESRAGIRIEELKDPSPDPRKPAKPERTIEEFPLF